MVRCRQVGVQPGLEYEPLRSQHRHLGVSTRLGTASLHGAPRAPRTDPVSLFQLVSEISDRVVLCTTLRAQDQSACVPHPPPPSPKPYAAFHCVAFAHTGQMERRSRWRVIALLYHTATSARQVPADQRVRLHRTPAVRKFRHTLASVITDLATRQHTRHGEPDYVLRLLRLVYVV